MGAGNGTYRTHRTYMTYGSRSRHAASLAGGTRLSIFINRPHFSRRYDAALVGTDVLICPTKMGWIWVWINRKTMRATLGIQNGRNQ